VTGTGDGVSRARCPGDGSPATAGSSLSPDADTFLYRNVSDSPNVAAAK
jgi:hypothetical protein